MALNKEVLKEINNIQDSKCKACRKKGAFPSTSKGHDERLRYCNTMCVTGRKLQELGKQLQKGK